MNNAILRTITRSISQSSSQQCSAAVTALLTHRGHDCRMANAAARQIVPSQTSSAVDGIKRASERAQNSG